MDGSDSLPPLLFRAEFDLSRKQRARAHLSAWGAHSLFAVFFSLAALFLSVMRLLDSSLPTLHVVVSWLVVLFWFRGFWIGWIEILLRPDWHVVIEIREMTEAYPDYYLGYGHERTDWWFPLSSLQFFKRTGSDLWTMAHRHGVVLSIPSEFVPSAWAEWIQSQIAAGQTPEGARRIVERGKHRAAAGI